MLMGEGDIFVMGEAFRLQIGVSAPGSMLLLGRAHRGKFGGKAQRSGRLGSSAAGCMLSVAGTALTGKTCSAWPIATGALEGTNALASGLRAFLALLGSVIRTAQEGDEGFQSAGGNRFIVIGGRAPADRIKEGSRPMLTDQG